MSFFVCYAVTDNLFHDGGETLRIRGLAVVIAERLFVQITEQMERLNADIGAMQTALEQAPEILHRVRVNIAVRIFDRMIDDGVLVSHPTSHRRKAIHH